MTIPFFSPKYVEATINEQPRKFYAARLYVVGQLKGFLKPLFRGLAELSATYDTDISKESVDTSEGGSRQLRTTLTAIEPALAKQRQQQRQALIDSLVEDLTSPAAMLALGRLCLDALRDDFPGKPNDQQIRQFVDDADMPTLVVMLKAVAEANKEVFGPLTDRAKTAIDALRSKVEPIPETELPEDPVAGDPDLPSEPQDEQPAKETTTTASGSN